MISFFRIVAFVCIAWITAGYSMQVYPITKTGRIIQLDGFLLEWKKDSTKTLGSSSQWHWDAVSTREGLAGYFTFAGSPACSAWSCSFLPHHVSPYKQMVLNTNEISTNAFYRVSHEKTGAIKEITAEWLIPWDSIAVDSSGYYSIGCLITTSLGDTLLPFIFNGQKYYEKKAVWSDVYTKGIILVILLAGVLLSQVMLRRAKRKIKRQAVP